MKKTALLSLLILGFIFLLISMSLVLAQTSGGGGGGGSNTTCIGEGGSISTISTAECCGSLDNFSSARIVSKKSDFINI